MAAVGIVANQDVWIELIKITPSLLWIILFIIMIIIFYRPIHAELLPKLTSFELGLVKLSFVMDTLNAAVELANKSPQWKVVVSQNDRERVMNRAKKNRAVFSKTKFLWVDDFPENNLNERSMFQQFGVIIDTAKSTDEALSILGRAKYDVIITDMLRGDNHFAGIEFINKLSEKDSESPVIVYIGVMDPTKGLPNGAFGLCNRPNDLLHFILDILERKKS